MASIGMVSLLELVATLAMAILLSGYERRAMAHLHQRDAPTVLLVLGMGQPVVEGAKLTSKATSTYHGNRVLMV